MQRPWEITAEQQIDVKTENKELMQGRVRDLVIQQQFNSTLY